MNPISLNSKMLEKLRANAKGVKIENKDDIQIKSENQKTDMLTSNKDREPISDTFKIKLKESSNQMSLNQSGGFNKKLAKFDLDAKFTDVKKTIQSKLLNETFTKEKDKVNENNVSKGEIHTNPTPFKVSNKFDKDSLDAIKIKPKIEGIYELGNKKFEKNIKDIPQDQSLIESSKKLNLIIKSKKENNQIYVNEEKEKRPNIPINNNRKLEIKKNEKYLDEEDDYGGFDDKEDKKQNLKETTKNDVDKRNNNKIIEPNKIIDERNKVNTVINKKIDVKKETKDDSEDEDYGGFDDNNNVGKNEIISKKEIKKVVIELDEISKLQYERLGQLKKIIELEEVSNYDVFSFDDSSKINQIKEESIIKPNNKSLFSKVETKELIIQCNSNELYDEYLQKDLNKNVKTDEFISLPNEFKK